MIKSACIQESRSQLQKRSKLAVAVVEEERKRVGVGMVGREGSSSVRRQLSTP